MKNTQNSKMTTYVGLCTSLSRFVQHEPSDALCKELQKILDDLLIVFDHMEVPFSDKVALDSSLLLPLTSLDDLVLLSLNNLLSSFVLKSTSQALKESSFKVFLRLLQRSKSRMNRNCLGQGPRGLSFIQSCVVYLPTPPAAADKDDENVDSVNLSTQPEELRLAILQCLWELLEGCEQEREIQFQVDQQDFFAYLVASLLHVAERDRCREAALRAIEVLKSVLFFNRDALTLRQYLPGIASGLSKSANAPQQASKVVVAALQCLATALDLCLSDDHLQRQEKDKQQSFTLEAIRQSIEATDVKKNHEVRPHDTVEQNSDENDKWLEMAAVNLDVLLSRMFAASVTAPVDGTTTGLPRSSWRVRCAIAQLCGTVMLRCQQALRGSFFRCYDELLVLRGDAIAQVAQEADTVLQQLHMSALSSEERLRMLPEMADRFQMLLSTLVLKVATEHEATKMYLVRTIRGYVAFLGSSLSPYLDTAIESIYTSLCRVVSFAALDIELEVHQALPSPAESNEKCDRITPRVVVSQFQKRLRYFNEEASVREVLAMLRDIGAVSTPAGFIDCAFTLLTEGKTKSTEADGAEIVLVLNEFLRAYSPNNRSETHVAHQSVHVYLIGRILEDLLALDAWRKHKCSSNRGSSMAIVSQRALMVECVGVCAEILGAEFKVFLLHVLYPMVEQLGSTSVEVERAALAALEKVYFFTGYDSLEALFQANMDYFVDALCARLEDLDMYPMTAFVVEALLRHTRLDSLPLVDEVASSLLHSVDLYQDSSHIGGLLRALKTLVESIAQDAQASGKTRVHEDKPKKSATSYALLDNFIHEMKVLENDGIDALEIDPENDEETRSIAEKVEDEMPPGYGKFLPGSQRDAEEQEEEEIPSGKLAVVIDIMNRCGYFLVDSDPIACCLVLSLIDEGVRFLANHPKELLPLVACMWPELLPRLRVENRAIITNTIHVITTLAETAGDFVGDRFVETVWPILRSQLQSICFESDTKSSQLARSMLLLSIESPQSHGSGVETPGSLRKDMSAVNGRRKTQETRQLLAILSCLTSVCRQSETVTQLVPEISRICCKYLSSCAPREVVEQTSELFSVLVQLNSDEVFCTMAALVDWVPPRPPSARFSAYEADAARYFYREYLSDLSGHVQSSRDNARVLMNELFK